jgi:hypothetical protein
MKKYIVYSNASGKILRTGICPDEMVDIQKLGVLEEAIEGEAHDLTQYINTEDQTVVNKTENPATINKTDISANGVDSATISGLPTDSLVTANNMSYEVTDGIFEFTIDSIGIYVIRCDSFPYLIKEFTVNAS